MPRPYSCRAGVLRIDFKRIIMTKTPPPSTTPASGFRDFLPVEASRRSRLMSLISDTYESFGFEPIDSPALENLNVLEGSGGGDENEKLIFKVLKRGEKFKQALGKSDENDYADLGLRFDLTVPLSRMVAEYRGQIHFPWKVFHIANVWRAERAQKGRFREFTQCDVDIIGSKSQAAELEVIQAVAWATHRAGARGFELKINDRRILLALAKHFGFGDSQADAFAILLDKKDKVPVDELEKDLCELAGKKLSSDLQDVLRGSFGLDRVKSLVGDIADSLQSLIESLEALKLPLERISFDASLARGLSYYTGTVFELRHASAGYSLGGGGRYDKLIGRFSKHEVPACGFSIGFDRLLLLLAESETLADKPVFIPVMDEKLRLKLSTLAAEIRSEGIKVDLYPEEAKLKAQFKFASDKAYRWVLILGEDEDKEGLIKLKDFQSGQETSLAQAQLKTTLKNLLFQASSR